MKQSHRIYFVDTSYLDELFAVPDFSNVQAVPEVRKRFELAWKAQGRLFIPLGVLLEFGNHVAKIRNEHDRVKWARLLHEVVVEALDPTKQSRRFALTEALVDAATADPYLDSRSTSQERRARPRAQPLRVT